MDIPNPDLAIAFLIVVACLAVGWILSRAIGGKSDGKR